tara:strand:- start:7 stop:357 length:351 start_codon:yes stop_codon:yes gene_type:complete
VRDVAAMKSKGNAPTAAQKRWREAVRDLGSIISGGPAVIHHAVGATGKHNKVEIGHEFILPLTEREHKDLHSGAILNGFNRKEFEKFFFKRVWRELFYHKDIPDEKILDAIMDYHR